MISPEELRRYPFFSFMTHEQMREVAMITDEMEAAEGETLFHIDDPADACYMIVNGAVDLHYVVIDEHEPDLRKDFMVGSVNPGELLGVSAVVEPYEYTVSAVAIEDAKLLKTDAEALRELCENDLELAHGLQRQIAKETLAKLHSARVQLAAATAPG